MTIRDCAMCAKPFNVPSAKPQQKYCCRECWRKSRLKQVEKTCERCGNAFSVYQARGEARFCSWACRSGKIEKICEYCGSTYHIKMSSAHKRSTCSRTCARKLQARNGKHPGQGKQRTPETKQKVSDGLKRFYNGNPQKHWNFQEGPFAQRRGVHSSWQKQRLLTRQRDNFTCRVCGITEEQHGKQLSVHHIKPFRLFANSDEANRLDNLISACQSCHMKLEHGTVNFSE